MKINYLSHGKFITGGFLHEKFYAESLHAFLNDKGIKSDLKIIREERFFESHLSHFKLLFSGFLKADADVNILVSRYSLPAFLKSVFNKKKYILVFHYEDEKDGKSFFLRLYFKLTFALINLVSNKNIAILTVAPYWQSYFKRKLPNTEVLYFPNFISSDELKKVKSVRSKMLIHLGQFSWKNHNDVFLLAATLKLKGFHCYFSTNNLSESGSFENYDVYADSRDGYLKRMASASYTIAFVSISEGWNRVAHESIILGTPVIGFDKGGLGDLLKESNSFLVDNIHEAIDIIISGKVHRPNINFALKYESQNAFLYLNDSIRFILCK